VTLTAWDCDTCGHRLAEFRLGAGSELRVWCTVCQREHRYQRAVQADPLALLTPREREIAKLIAQGVNGGQIGRLLVIEHGTVKVHIAHILEKLGVHTQGAIGFALGRAGAFPDLEVGEGEESA